MRNLHSRDNSYVSRILMGERIRYSYIIGIWKFYFLEFFAIYILQNAVNLIVLAKEHVSIHCVVLN